ncbi:CheR family methyltransferase [Geomesophilobacter sediminis]|uniref:protein-glutamate O-methyltransferase n=1 Tax=Geomesophilobacter sediminis TaxID=2798584 RepID=A0A8J7S8X1_9BACT|nr:protein-glutamate O-methyltransferase CheR [Geomesophilobacter sediminis]MBJ6727901.1 protein-glutamate O-methyltransferase CheR [Geomesophilobacter sediminis]
MTSPSRPLRRTVQRPSVFREINPEIAPETFQAIARLLQACYGFTLTSYKDKCVKRRINIRIQATFSPSPESYLALLNDSPAELERLVAVLTIHVSHFFRNPSVFALLREAVLPELFARRPGPITIWSSGCATGEEPYSLALILRENFRADLVRRPVSIVGTDIDAATLVRAAQGSYGPERLGEVSEEQLRRWFTPEGERFRLRDEIRSLVQFQELDLHHSERFVPSDLILCRNVLIYFERERQQEIIAGFARALGAGGVLVLGKAETLVGPTRRLFEPISSTERIYRVL